MANTQRMRAANDKASKNVHIRGNVPKGQVSVCIGFRMLFLVLSPVKHRLLTLSFSLFRPLVEGRRIEVCRRSMAARSLPVCCLWLCSPPDHSEHPNVINWPMETVYRFHSNILCAVWTIIIIDFKLTILFLFYSSILSSSPVFMFNLCMWIIVN